MKRTFGRIIAEYLGLILWIVALFGFILIVVFIDNPFAIVACAVIFTSLISALAAFLIQ